MLLTGGRHFYFIFEGTGRGQGSGEEEGGRDALGICARPADTESQNCSCLLVLAGVPGRHR